MDIQTVQTHPAPLGEAPVFMGAHRVVRITQSDQEGSGFGEVRHNQSGSRP